MVGILLFFYQTHFYLERPLAQFRLSNPAQVHPSFPNTRWSHLEPCGAHFDELAQYLKSFQCVRDKTYPGATLPDIPRCFIVTVDSPDVFTMDKMYNFIPLRVSWDEVSALMGVYEPFTKTVFIVENLNVAKTYRHEVQHYFLHELVAGSDGSGHDQQIWKDCEGQYYAPSLSDQLNQKILKNLD